MKTLLFTILVILCTACSPVVTAPPPAAATPVATLNACGLHHTVNINTANGPELESLPGIGPDLAQRIINHIAINGYFMTLEDLLEVDGIGQAALTLISSCISLETE